MYVITRLLHLTITCATEAKVRLRASPTFALRSFYSANPFIISYNYPKALTTSANSFSSHKPKEWLKRVSQKYAKSIPSSELAKIRHG